MIQGCERGVKGAYRDFSRGYLRGVTGALPGFYRSVTGVFQGCYSMAVIAGPNRGRHTSVLSIPPTPYAPLIA